MLSPRTTATLICVVIAGAYLMAAGPLFAVTVFALLGVGVFASLRFGAWVRQVTIVCGLVGLMFVFPGRTGDRTTAESNAISTLRLIHSTEEQYARSLNEGFYDTLHCLTSVGCVPAPVTMSAPLEAGLSGEEPLRGYRFVFHAGPSPDAPNPRISRSSVTRYAVVAVPAGPRTNKRRSFCLDDTGKIYATPDAGVPRVDAGRCVDTSRPIQ